MSSDHPFGGRDTASAKHRRQGPGEHLAASGPGVLRSSGEEDQGKGERLVPSLLALRAVGSAERFELRVMSVVACPACPRSGIGAAGTLRDVGRAPRTAIAEAAIIELSRMQLETLSADIARLLDAGSGEVRLAPGTAIKDAEERWASAPGAAMEATAAALRQTRAPGWPTAIAALSALMIAGAVGLMLTGQATQARLPTTAASNAATPAIAAIRSWPAPTLAPKPPAPVTMPAPADLAAVAPLPILAPTPAPTPAFSYAAAPKPVAAAVQAATAPPAMVLSQTTPVAPGAAATEPIARLPAAARPVGTPRGDFNAPPPHLAVRASAEAWVRLSDARGATLIRRLLRPGEMVPIPPIRGVRLTTGNAGGTELMVDGVAGLALGRRGAVLTNLDLDTIAN